MMATLVAATNYLALYVENTLGYSPLASGVRFLPLTVAAFVAAPLAAALPDRIPARLTISGSLGLAAVGMALMARLHGDSQWTALLAGFLIAGVGLGAASAATSNAALTLSTADPSRTGMVTGTINTMRQTGLATGVAVLGAVFQRRATDAASPPIAATGLPREAVTALANAIGSGSGLRATTAVPGAAQAVADEAARTATTLALNDVLRIGAIAAGVAAAVALITIRRESSTAPDAEPGHYSTQPTEPIQGWERQEPSGQSVDAGTTP